MNNEKSVAVHAQVSQASEVVHELGRRDLQAIPAKIQVREGEAAGQRGGQLVQAHFTYAQGQ